MKRLFCTLALLLGLAQTPVLGEGEPVAIIVNPENKVTELSRSKLASIYKGESDAWPDGQKILVVNQVMDSETRRRFYASVLQAGPMERILVPGTPLPFHAMVFKSDRVIVRFVASTPTAIGYVSLSSVLPTVKVLRLDGVMPGEPAYAIE
jgi:phosphate transport system substrate-binding protein